MPPFPQTVLTILHCSTFFSGRVLEKMMVLLTNKKKCMSTQKIVVGTLSAALAGVVVGLLIAPAKGSDTRHKIAESAEMLRKKLRSIRNSADDELNDLQDIFENEVEGLKDDVRQKVLNLIEASKKSYNNVKEEALSN
jgi:gas vesicle protein